MVKVQDLGEVEEGIFVVSEWRTGMDLQWFMQQNRDLPLGQKLALIAQVAEGLAFAHSREIAHGDLKPSNVFVDGARDVTILDFGIAKWLAALLDCRQPPGRPGGQLPGAGTGAGATVRRTVRHLRARADALRVRCLESIRFRQSPG